MFLWNGEGLDCGMGSDVSRDIAYFSGLSSMKEERWNDIQGVSRLQDITAGGDFLGLCDEKS